MADSPGLRRPKGSGARYTLSTDTLVGAFVAPLLEPTQRNTVGQHHRRRGTVRGMMSKSSAAPFALWCDRGATIYLLPIIAQNGKKSTL